MRALVELRDPVAVAFAAATALAALWLGHDLVAITAATVAVLVARIGAGVALHVALRRPDLVRGLVLISAAFHHSGQMAVDEIDVDQVVAAFGASYGEVSPDGEDHYAVVVTKEIEMDEREPTLEVSDLASVTARTLVMTSDDDLITLEHTVALYRGITNAELAVVPGTSHFLTQEKPDVTTRMIVDFLGTEPITPIAAVRRAHRA